MKCLFRNALLLVSLQLVWIISQVQGQQCTQIESCDICLKSSAVCKWCSDEGFSGPRCLPVDDNTTQCQTGFENLSVKVDLLENHSFDNEVQVLPQKVSLKIRPGEEASFDLKVKPAPNFPLDVYFLMDVSFSMLNDLRAMQRVTFEVAKVLEKITMNYTLGFGSFVDKPTDPYIDRNIDYINDPCKGVNYAFCEKPFGFHHLVSLTNSTDIFKGGIATQRISINVDSPEGGSDGMLQVAVCNDLIGWRPHPARKLLVYITDAHFHFAYDGKLGGAVTPNDGKCHMTKKGRYYEYDETERMDYPSLSMLIDKLQQENIFPVFGVAVLDTNGNINNNAVYQSYQNITQNFPNAVIEPLTTSSSNLVTAIENAYKTIASRVQLSIVGGDKKNLQVEFESNCGGNETVFSSECSGVTVGKEVTFKVKVSADECIPELRNGTSFMIGTGFFGQVEVNVEMACGCECSTRPEINSSTCSGFGTLLCGECNCDPGRFGKTCQCGSDSNATDLSVECEMVNGQVCSGPEAGECHCGKCICHEEKGYYGSACQCNRFSCLRNSKNQICSGHGTCECGQCVCDRAPSGRRYTGEICDCYPDDDVCRKSPKEAPCSGRGTCMCGECTQCAPGYSGLFCEICVNTTICGPELSITCKVREKCIRCLFKPSGSTLIQNPLSDCQTECRNTSTIVLGTTSSFLSSPNTTECRTDPCDGVLYYLNSNKNVIQVSNTPAICTGPDPGIPAWLIVVPIIVGLLLLAIAFVILVKLIIIYLDHREYKKWMKDVKATQFAEFCKYCLKKPKRAKRCNYLPTSDFESPLYLSAWQKFYCPMYPGNLERGLVGSVSPSMLPKRRKMSISMPDITAPDAIPPRMRQKTAHGSAPPLREKSESVDPSSTSSREESVDTRLDDEASIRAKPNPCDDDDCGKQLQELITSLSVEHGLNEVN